MLLKILRKQSDYSDEQLVVRYQKSGDLYYVGLLFERYNEMTVSLCLNYLKNETDAEDAAMDCFELLVKDLKGTSVKQFGAWYYTVVRNLLLKTKRQREKRYYTPIVEGYHDEAEEDQLLLSLFEQDKPELTAMLEDVFDNLKPLQRKCVDLFYLKQKSYIEIANELKISEKEVKSHLQNGKRKLKIVLNENNIYSSDDLA